MSIVKIILAMGLICLTSAAARAQPDSTAVETFELRPLDDLLRAAIQHSPALKLERIDAELLYSELKLLKKEWSNYAALTGSFQAGNVQFVDNLSGGSAPDVRTVTRENIFAVAGITIRLPLSDFITKPERRRMLEMKIDQARYDVQQREMDIRMVVIRQYNDLQRALRTLEIRTRDLNVHELAAENAERYFRQGNTDLDTYTTIVNKRNEAEVRQSDAQLDAQLLYLLLRELVGQEIKL